MVGSDDLKRFHGLAYGMLAVQGIAEDDEGDEENAA